MKKTETEKRTYTDLSGYPEKAGAVPLDHDQEWEENERFRRCFQKAFEQYDSDDLKPDRPLDLSFLPEEVAAMLREEDPLPLAEDQEITKKTFRETSEEQTKRSRRFSFHPSWWAAAILLCVLRTGGMTWWMNSQDAYAARFRLEKMLYQLSGNYYVSDPEEDGSTDAITIRIDDPQDLDRAARFMPELLTPGYIPASWQLESLDLAKTLHGDKQAVFTYIAPESGLLSIEENYPADSGMVQAEKAADSHTVQRGSHVITLYHDPVSDNPAAEFVENRVQVRIRGDLSEEDLLRIADNIEPGCN